MTDDLASLHSQGSQTTPTKKRKRNHENPKDVNEFLPSRPVDEAATYGSMEFNEVLDEEVPLTRVFSSKLSYSHRSSRTSRRTSIGLLC